MLSKDGGSSNPIKITAEYYYNAENTSSGLNEYDRRIAFDLGDEKNNFDSIDIANPKTGIPLNYNGFDLGTEASS
jgi:hypothetical protein